MALMYDMETVNRAMQTAASFVASGGTEREKYILNTFAAMKPVEAEQTVHAKWIFNPYEGEPWCECSNCYYTPSRKAYKEAHRCCPCCGALMDGRVEA